MFMNQDLENAVKNLSHTEGKVYTHTPSNGAAPMRTKQIAALADMKPGITASVMTKLRRIGVIKSIRLGREFAHQKTDKLEPHEPLIQSNKRKRHSRKSGVKTATGRTHRQDLNEVEIKLRELNKVLNHNVIAEAIAELDYRNVTIHTLSKKLQRVQDAIK